MTDYAFRVHKELVEFEGVDPKSKKYYDEIDKRIYNRFKDRLIKYYSIVSGLKKDFLLELIIKNYLNKRHLSVINLQIEPK